MGQFVGLWFFHTLCHFPHNLIKEKLVNLIEWTFVGRVRLILPVAKDGLSSLLKTRNDINFGLAKTSVGP